MEFHGHYFKKFMDDALRADKRGSWFYMTGNFYEIIWRCLSRAENSSADDSVWQKSTVFLFYKLRRDNFPVYFAGRRHQRLFLDLSTHDGGIYIARIRNNFILRAVDFALFPCGRSFPQI